MTVVPDSAAAATRRTRLASMAMAANLVALGAASVLAFFTVRWTLPYLGKDRFGMWMTLASLAGMMSIADLGIGNALVSRVAATRADGRQACADAITGGLGLLAGLAVGFAVLIGVSAWYIPWHHVFSLPPDSAAVAEFRQGAVLFGPIFGVFLLAGGVRKVYEGLQQGFVVHLVSAGASLCAVAALWDASSRQLGIPWLFGATFGITNAFLLVLLVPLVSRGLLQRARMLAAIRFEHRNLLSVGGMYLVLQFGSLAMTGSEAFLISIMNGPAVVASFAVVQRLFQYVATPARLINAPMWGAYADAHARHDTAYIRHSLMRLLAATGGVTLLLVGGAVVMAPWLIPAWTQGAEEADMGLVSVYGIWTLLDCAFLPLVVYMNGIGLVRPQAACTVFSLFTYYPAKIVALAYAGVTAMMWVTVAFYVFNAMLFYGVLYGRELARGWCRQ
jgi:O-antigen/teichoic acid export membrane protein